MRTLVIYRSKTGFAKTYAEWIADELEADLLGHSAVSVETFAAYDAIVFGGGLYAGGINGLTLITGNMNRLEGKKIAVFATGATPPRKKDLEEVRDKNFTPEQLKRLRFFYLRGGFSFQKLGFVDKILMRLLKLKIELKKRAGQKPHPDEAGMLSAFSRPVDFMRKKNIEELTAYMKNHSGTAAATTL